MLGCWSYLVLNILGGPVLNPGGVVCLVADHYGTSFNSVATLLLTYLIQFCHCGTVDVLYNIKLTAIVMIFQTYPYSMIKVMNLTLRRPFLYRICVTHCLLYSACFLLYTFKFCWWKGLQVYLVFSFHMSFYSLRSISVCIIDFWVLTK